MIVLLPLRGVLYGYFESSWIDAKKQSARGGRFEDTLGRLINVICYLRPVANSLLI